MTAATVETRAEAEIRNLIDAYAEAVRSKDVDRIVSHFSPDVVAFDAIAALRFQGRDAYRAHWEMCMSMCSGPMMFEVHELTVAARDDVAFGHYLCRCGGTGPDGEERSSWMRVTVGCRRIDGRWLIAHEHFSVPFDPASGKAMFDLQP